MGKWFVKGAELVSNERCFIPRPKSIVRLDFVAAWWPLQNPIDSVIYLKEFSATNQ